jgi:hypothetical protein
MELKLPEIRHDQTGFEALVDLYSKTKACFAEDIDIDMSRTTWFDADMCAAFGAILYSLGEGLNAIRLMNIRPHVEKILSKNAFLSYYGREKVPDQWGTTITYQRFEAKDDRFFANYIENELVQRQQIPVMSTGLKKKFRESIFEIFSNAVLHSGTEWGIFSCGQFFPNRHLLDFSVVDLGIGIRANILKKKMLDLSSEKAIQWATEDNNTTKTAGIPGGIGLKILNEFIDLNGGSIQIVSDTGYWQRKNHHTVTAILKQPFPGTVVTIEINTADEHSYILASELRSNEIF